MKKSFLTLAVLCLTCAVFAIDPVTLEGKFNVKKAKKEVAVFSFDWSQTKVGGIDDGIFVTTPVPMDEYLAKKDQEKINDGKPEDANFVRDWPSIKQEAEDLFKKTWNKEFKKGLQLSRNPEGANYKLNFVIEGIDFGNVAGSVFGWGNAGGAIIKGYGVLTDNAGNEILRMNINHVQGPGHFSDRYRTILVLNELVEEINDAY